MKREVLLIEPNYKNKYPPMGLMKLATYFRNRGDNVRFFKGDLRNLAVENLFEDFWSQHSNAVLYKQIDNIKKHIKTGKNSLLDSITDPFIFSAIKNCHACFKNKEWKKYDLICVTTLFTFYWNMTVDTINDAKAFLNENGRILVGGISASILSEKTFEATGIKPHKGLLDEAGIIDIGSKEIIDNLSLDYSILDEVDYSYPSANAYFGYMTRGCKRGCSFCAVEVLEPEYKHYISIREQLNAVSDRFGERRDLLLLDNNVLISKCFNRIIDDIKDMGFAKDASYTPSCEYVITLHNLRNDYNTRANLRKIIKLYDLLIRKLDDEKIGELYIERERLGLLRYETATISAVEELDAFVSLLFKKHIKQNPLVRYVDFNQGVDLRAFSETKAKRLSEINIKPLRIAFDDWSLRDKYESAIRLSTTAGMTDLSNYLLYNSDIDVDTPLNLYRRMRLNVDLCEELGISIFSFPMKYHPINDPEYFNNRDYIGKHWNRKYIRAIQAVLNSTRGKIGRGKQFFEAAFGENEAEFNEIIMMPEALIIHRFEHDQVKRERFNKADKYIGNCDNLTGEWRESFNALTEEQLMVLLPIVHKNSFNNIDIEVNDPAVKKVLRFYQIQRPRD